MIEIVIIAVALLAALYVRVAMPFALLFAAAIGLGAALGEPMGAGSGKTMMLLANTVTSSMSSYSTAALLILVFIGALFERCGTVIAVPYGGQDRSLPLDRSTGFSGGAFGLPLPAMGAVILVCLITETSITGALTATLLPLIVLALTYLAIFLPTALAGSRRMRHPALPPDVFSLVLACAVPPVFLLVLIVPTASGTMTPTETMGIVVVLAAVITILHISMSRHARAALGDGILRGAAAVAMVIVLVIALVALGQLFAFTEVPHSLANAIQSYKPTPYLVAIFAVALALGLGAVTGPLTGIGLATILAYPALNAAEMDPLNYVMMMAATAEAIRVGPQLHGSGFLKRVRDDGETGLGTWPYYAAAVCIALLAPLLPAISPF